MGVIVALVGAGGKTTTMLRLATKLAAGGKRVITTTTTHIFPPAPVQTEATILAIELASLLGQAAAALTTHRNITVATSITPEGKLRGLPPDWVNDLCHLPGVSAVLVEADGARGRMIKAPADHEPVIPSGANLVLALASAAAMGQPLSDTIAHRLERVAAITGLNDGNILTPQALSRLAISEQGLLKAIPQEVPAILVLTHVDEPVKSSAQEVASYALATGRFAGVLLCSHEWARYVGETDSVFAGGIISYW